jgi:hypothetical protein
MEVPPRTAARLSSAPAPKAMIAADVDLLVAK